MASPARDGARRVPYEFFKGSQQTMTTSLKAALKTHFGFENFRSKLQEDVVKAVVRGESADRRLNNLQP